MKELQLKQTFSGMDKMFNSDFELEESCKEKPKSTAVAIPKEDTEPELLEDSDYITTELKQTVQSISDIMEIMTADLKIGTPPRMFEVYSTLANAKIAALDKLTSKSKIKMDAKMKSKSKDNNSSTTTNNMIFTSKNLLELLKKENPKTNTEVSFDIEVD